MWDIVTSILYIECGVVSLLVLPIVTLNQWTQLIYSNLMQTVSRVMKPWIYVYICLLTCSILNSLRIMRQKIDPDSFKEEEQLLQYNLRQAMAQRNFYISSASIFLMALARRLVLMKMTQAEEVEDFLNFGVEYMPGRRESNDGIAMKATTTAAPATSTTTAALAAASTRPKTTSWDQRMGQEQTIEPVLIDDLRLADKNVDEYKNWSDLEEWSNRMRRITSNLVKEEQNNEALKSCAKRLSNFCMRLDEDYKQIQSILGNATIEPLKNGDQN